MSALSSRDARAQQCADVRDELLGDYALCLPISIPGSGDYGPGGLGGGGGGGGGDDEEPNPFEVSPGQIEGEALGQAIRLGAVPPSLIPRLLTDAGLNRALGAAVGAARRAFHVLSAGDRFRDQAADAAPTVTPPISDPRAPTDQCAARHQCVRLTS